MSRSNLIKNPSFRSGLENWTGLGAAALSITNEYAFYGSESLQVVKSDQPNSGVQYSNPELLVSPSLPYAASVYVRVPSTVPVTETADLALKIVWVDSTGSTISESISNILDVVSGGGWVRLSVVDIAPTGAHTARLSITQLVTGTADEVFLVDAALFEQSSYVGGYLDSLTQAQETKAVNTALRVYPAPTVGGPQLNADILLGNLVLNTIDEEGVVWICTDINGWWSPSTADVPDIPRGVEDGSYDVSGRYTSRVVTLEGVFYPQGPERLSGARDKLISAINLVRRGGWLRTNEEPSKASFMRMVGKPQIQTVNARGKTIFSVTLRASDPIKYEWNDADEDGLTTETITGTDSVAVVSNIGTADVTAVFEITGPIGAGSTVYNNLTDETITLVQPLRGSGATASITKREIFNNTATLTTDAPHQLLVGDLIDVTGVGAPFDSVDDPWVVTAATSTFPYTFSYTLVNEDIPDTNSSGSVLLPHPDVLEVDTYNRSVTFNGSVLGHRNRVETLVDWIKLGPGNNTIVFDDEIAPFEVVYKEYDGDGSAELTLDEAHFLSPGDLVSVELPESAALSNKELVSDQVILTTETPHGFAVGDVIDVVSVEQSHVINKELTSDVATLTTLEPEGFAEGDNITVALPVAATVISKSRLSNVATLTVAEPHGFSIGDDITVTLPTVSAVTSKALSGGKVTLTVSAPHNFSAGDTITVALPTSTTVVGKVISGSSVTLTTATPHGFSVGDKINVAFTASTALTGTRSFGGIDTSLITVETAAPHGFSVGDTISVNIGVPPSALVTDRSATTTECTLTTLATHQYSVGESITVSGVGARYNGTHIITAVDDGDKTVTYEFDGVAESITSSGGAILNNTINNGYNGTKIVEAVTSTSISYLYYGQENTTSSTLFGTTPTATNTTSAELNGTVTITSTPNTSQFTYTKGV